MAGKIPGIDAAAAEFNRVLGAAVRRERKRCGLTIQQLADRVGIGLSTLSQYERGTRPIDTYVLVRICHVLKVQRDVLLDEATQRADELIPNGTLTTHDRNGGDT